MICFQSPAGAGLPAKSPPGKRPARWQARNCKTNRVFSGCPVIKSTTMPAMLLAVILSLMSTMLQAGETVRTLAPCPESPNCVSSQAGDRAHYAEPLRYTGAAAQAWKRLEAALGRESRLTIVEDTGGYLHAEARTLVFRFVDDVEFQLDPDERVIHVRSASRVGYSDFGVNRRRVERIRKAFGKQS